MGLLAGSTVMLLTIIWGTCVLIGKCDLESSRAVDEIDTKGLSLVGKNLLLVFSFSFLLLIKNL